MLFTYNIDASIFNENNSFSVNLFVGTHGAFIQARTLLFLGLPEPQEIEAWGLLEALKWTKSMNLANVTYELD